jgi:beta-N-acetylhexosaminidase
MKKLLVLFLTVFLTLTITGCMSHSAKDSVNNNEKISIRGEIKKVEMDSNGEFKSIYVEGKIEADTQYDKAVIALTPETVYLTHESMGHSSKHMIGKGVKVEVTFDGPVAESSPVQATAKSLKAID